MIELIRKSNIEEQKKLAKELREALIEIVSKTGGHLASNLGVVELTIALHSVFNTPNDKIIFDVGHQTYVHKMITRRKEELKNIRVLNGISGFPKTSESIYDSFNTGHSSTSISAALGMAKARDIKGESNYVIAVIGDGALTGGMALEALNDAGSSKTNLIVILNDNEMSIEKNVGSISTILTNIRTKKIYNNSNKYVRVTVEKIPIIGHYTMRIFKRVKKAVKQAFISNMFFEDLGFTYLGPIDGNDLEAVTKILKRSKKIEGPILIHLVTKKGLGYKKAEDNPHKYHSIAPFDIETGQCLKQKGKDYSKVFGDKLVSLAEDNKKIVAITAAMTSGVGLTDFSIKYPDRFFDVGIAEQHALTFSAGLAISGLKPVVSIYSSFYQRAYDQIIHDICLQKLPVVMCIDRAGIVGADGETHQGIYDMAFLNVVPNLTIMAPKDFIELSDMLEFACEYDGAIAIRYPRQSTDEIDITFNKHDKISLGKAEYVIEAKGIVSLCIFAIGKMVETSCHVAYLLKQKGIYCDVVNIRFLKPLDENMIVESLIRSNVCITIEDGCISGGLATSVLEVINKHKLNNIKFKAFAYPNEFIKHGTIKELEKEYGLDKDSIVKEVKKLLDN